MYYWRFIKLKTKSISAVLKHGKQTYYPNIHNKYTVTGEDLFVLDGLFITLELIDYEVNIPEIIKIEDLLIV